MSFEPQTVITTIATLVRSRPDLLEISYHAGKVFTPEHVYEVQVERRRMMGDQRYSTITFVPEDMDFVLDSMRVDHAMVDRAVDHVVATAVVVRGSMMERLTNVYLKHYPLPQHVLVTDNETEARAWLKTQAEEAESADG